MNDCFEGVFAKFEHNLGCLGRQKKASRDDQLKCIVGIKISPSTVTRQVDDYVVIEVLLDNWKQHLIF